MPKDDEQQAFEKILSSNFGRVVDFVKFAEGKNGALFAFCSGWIIASVNFLNSQNALTSEYRTAFSLALPLFTLAALICLVSFLPRISLIRFHKRSDGARSLLFFGDMPTFEITALRQRFLERYLPPKGQSFTEKYLDDLCVQIAVNSQIATRKFRMFTASASCVLLAMAILSIPPIWQVFRIALAMAS